MFLIRILRYWGISVITSKKNIYSLNEGLSEKSHSPLTIDYFVTTKGVINANKNFRP